MKRFFTMEKMTMKHNSWILVEIYISPRVL